MKRRALSIALVVTLLSAAFVATHASAASSAPIPSSMAAVGDSITQAASTGSGGLGADAPANSWSTGTNLSVNSHLVRLRALNAQVTGHNLSVSGAKVADLNAQMLNVAALSPDPGYLTVLIGGNDLCTSSVGTMTTTADFRSRFATAMATVTAQSPGTMVYVVSIPDVWQLWNLFKGNFLARFTWSIAGICQSLLANPTSTQTADVQRRALVRQRNAEFNDVLESVCAAYASRCRYDNDAAFDFQFTTADVSGDYFHPSLTGQTRLAAVSWGAGYTWTAAPTPTPNPTATPVPTPDPTATPTPTPTPPPTATPTATPTPVVASMRIDDLSGSGRIVNSQNWQATVRVTVTDLAGIPIPNATVTGSWSIGAWDTCITGTDGSCTATSDNLKRRSVPSVRFDVTGVTHATLLYSPQPGDLSSVTTFRP
jgi:lysophospholipase L1-like esterase